MVPSSFLKGKRKETWLLWLEAPPLVSEGFSPSWHSLAADSLAEGVFEGVRGESEVVGRVFLFCQKWFVTLVISECSLCISSCNCFSLCWESRCCSCTLSSSSCWTSCCSACEGVCVSHVYVCVWCVCACVHAHVCEGKKLKSCSLTEQNCLALTFLCSSFSSFSSG